MWGKNCASFYNDCLWKSPLRAQNPFIPEFLWTLSSLNFHMTIDIKWWFQSKIENIMANSVGHDETARNEPSHQDLHCLHRYLFWSARLNGVKAY